MLFYIRLRLKILSDHFFKLLPALQPVQILLPFFHENLVKLFLRLQYPDLRHDLRIQKIILKGIISENEHIFLRHPGEPVHVLLISAGIITAELSFQFFSVFPVTVPDHEEIVLDIDLVHIFQIGIGLDIGTAVCRDDRDPGQIALIVIRLRIIFSDQKRKPALILFSFHDEDKIHIHQVIRRISKIIQHSADVGLLPDLRKSLCIQEYLTNLPAVEI